jgi:hypothetical protein
VTGNGAEISVVLVTPAGLDAIRRTVSHLRSQTACDRIELVMVGRSALRRDELPGGELEGFAGLQLVEAGNFPSTGAAFAAGVRAASAPIVACAEEHSFPEPGWAAALIEAHSGPWAAVGGTLENANPTTWFSWAHLLSDFGPAVAPVEGGEASELPGHHTSYKRDKLLGYGADLEGMLEIEWVLQEDLRAAGGRLLCEPRAVSHHVNASRIGSHLRGELNGGRAFAANRARLRGWSPLRRLIWIAGSPLMPLVRLTRTLPHVRRVRPPSRAGLLSVLAMGLTVNAFGQMLGYALGRGAATKKRMSLELSRHRHLRSDEQEALAAVPLGELPRLSPGR